MRGAHHRFVAVYRLVGIIPAYAGSTPSVPSRGWYRRDHPRVCGEHRVAGDIIQSALGSSPRMRGAPGGGARRAEPSGIIPAYAGSTEPDHGGLDGGGDHPRVCGEHLVLSPHLFRHRGSSPRMRGAPCDRDSAYDFVGIIPAYAGSTLRWSLTRRCSWDHPRVCGEHAMLALLLAYLMGSSPRMRGARGTRACRKPARGDHPRVCGEHR